VNGRVSAGGLNAEFTIARPFTPSLTKDLSATSGSLTKATSTWCRPGTSASTITSTSTRRPPRRIARSLSGGLDVCLTVTLIDGLVLARSAFHHSMNYRSVVAFGRARVVEDPAEMIDALRHFTNHIVPGRWDEVRQPTELELNATTVIALHLENVSAKIRTGPPTDDDADLAVPVWAGVVPLSLIRGEGIADARAAPRPI
jgi:hypothetical protein